MPNQAQVVNPPPGRVPANSEISDIEVQASGTQDYVNAPSSEIGYIALPGGSYTHVCALQHKQNDVYEPADMFLAPSGRFKIHGIVQFANNGQDTEEKDADHAGEFLGEVHGKPPKGRRGPKPGRKRRRLTSKPESDRKTVKGGAKPSRRSRRKPTATTKSRLAAKKRKSSAGKRGAPRRKK